MVHLITMEITQKIKFQIFIFRSQNQQFIFWGQKEQKWCEKYKDYFTIIDCGQGQIQHNIFKTMKISDFKNPLYLDDKVFHEGVGLLNIANNLDQFDYQYIGFIHMDMFPLYLNKRFIEENFYCGYPIIIDRLLDLDNLTLQKQTILSFQVLRAIQAVSWHLQTYDIVIDEKPIWQFLSEKFNLIDIINFNLQELRLSIACSFLAKKEFWKTIHKFIDNIDELSNLQKYGHKVYYKENEGDVVISQMIQAFIELQVLTYHINNDIKINLIPICHFN